jgi:hypothetical protein
MVWPIIAAALGGAAVGGIVASAMGKPEEQTINPTAAQEQKPQLTTYVPVEAPVDVYAPQTSETYAPQVTYQPVIQMGSPYAQALPQSKKESKIQTDMTQRAQAEPAIQPYVPFIMPQKTEQPTTTTEVGGDIGFMLMVGLLGLGALLLLKD